MRGARERIKAEKGKCGGRKSLEEHYGSVRFGKLLRKTKKLSDTGLSLAKITGILAEQGWVQPTTLRPYNKSQVRRLLQRGES